MQERTQAQIWVGREGSTVGEGEKHIQNIFLFIFLDRVSLCNSAQIRCVDHAGLEFTQGSACSARIKDVHFQIWLR